MTRRTTERRQRFNHLIGVDRCRVAYRFADGSIQTQSFDETTESMAKATAAANLTPFGSDRPISVEIYLGQFVARGQTDCEWTDLRQLAIGQPTDDNGVDWAISLPAIDPTAPTGQLGMFEGGAA